MAAADGHRPGELQTCAGLGWVKLDRTGDPGADGQTEVPAVRCVGMRFSQQLAPAGGGRAAEAAAGSRSRSVEAAGKGLSRSLGSEQTWALVCAGQLSMIMPPVTPAGSPLATATAVSRTPQLEPPWAPCHVHCDGISFRLEKVMAADSSAAASSTAINEASQPQREELPASSTLAAAGESDLLRVALRGAEAVAGRASSILWSVTGATHESGPGRLAADTASTARRICAQAGKIAKRSAEHVGRIALLPWRLAGGAGRAGEGGAPREG